MLNYPLGLIHKIFLFLFLLFNLSISFAWEDERELAMHMTPNLQRGKEIYQICVTCHNQTGWADGSDISRRQQPGFFPQLAGQHTNVIIKQLVDIRAGNRDNPMMYPFTLEKYLPGPQGIADVSGYIATLPVNPDKNNIGNGMDLPLGKDLYRTNCKNCHGDNGEGNNKEFYPRIQGQHFNYLLRQFIWIRDGRRRNSNKKMTHQIERFTFREMTAVIDYVSRLSVNTSNSKKILPQKK
ncbi:MAG: c-type cytochrome [Pseudomonadota bacterium]